MSLALITAGILASVVIASIFFTYAMILFGIPQHLRLQNAT